MRFALSILPSPINTVPEYAPESTIFITRFNCETSMATDLGVLEYLEAEQRREKLLAKVDRRKKRALKEERRRQRELHKAEQEKKRTEEVIRKREKDDKEKEKVRRELEKRYDTLVTPVKLSGERKVRLSGELDSADKIRTKTLGGLGPFGANIVSFPSPQRDSPRRTNRIKFDITPARLQSLRLSMNEVMEMRSDADILKELKKRHWREVDGKYVAPGLIIEEEEDGNKSIVGGTMNVDFFHDIHTMITCLRKKYPPPIRTRLQKANPTPRTLSKSFGPRSREISQAKGISKSKSILTRPSVEKRKRESNPMRLTESHSEAMVPERAFGGSSSRSRKILRQGFMVMRR